MVRFLYTMPFISFMFVYSTNKLFITYYLLVIHYCSHCALGRRIVGPFATSIIVLTKEPRAQRGVGLDVVAAVVRAIRRAEGI